MDIEKGEWFYKWFDSPLYHQLYKNRDDEEAHNFLDLLIKQLGIEPGARILDLGCGRGRYAKYLGSRGFNVLGADLSANSIDYARQFEHEKLQFRVHDMRQPIENESFNYILNLFTSFGYFNTDDEDKAVMTAMRKSMKKDGTLVIDYINGERAVRDLVKQEVVELDDLQFRISRWVDNNRIYKSIDVDNQQFREEVKLLSLDQFEEYAGATGFRIDSVFGNYQLDPFENEQSDRLIMILKIAQ